MHCKTLQRLVNVSFDFSQSKFILENTCCASDFGELSIYTLRFAMFIICVRILLIELFLMPTGYTLRTNIGSVVAVDLIFTLSQRHRIEFMYFIVTCLSVRGFTVTCFGVTCGMSYLASICIHFCHLYPLESNRAII